MSLSDAFDIYIPTYGRADNVKTAKVFPNAIIVCPESQEEEYRKHYPDMQFMPCPDSVEGNMAKKRNWIKDNARKDWFIMVDDDCDGIQMIEGQKQIRLEFEHMMELFHNAFVMCEEWGTVLWGLNLNKDPKVYREYSPFSSLSIILGPFSGHIKSNMRYDCRLPTKEDYDYGLQVLWKYHKVLRLNKYAYSVGHITGQTGGSHSIRKMELEEAQNELLVRKWGKKVVKYNMAKDIDPVVKVPLKGI